MIATAVGPAAVLVLIAATYALGSRYGKRVGIASALVVAAGALALLRGATPTAALLSDALWMTAVAAATGTARYHARAAGVAAGVAAALQPALAPLGLLIALFLLFRPERAWHVRRRAALPYALLYGAGVAVTVVAAQTSGAGAVGVALFAFSFLVIVPVALFIAAPFLIPGALTTLLMAGVVASLVLPFVVSAGTLTIVPPAVAVATGTVVIVAAFDAMWRRSRLPAPCVALTIASILLGWIEAVR